MTGFMGELSFVHIGVGYTLPFKVIAAPWISADRLADALNAARLPGVRFNPIRLKPFFGKFAHQSCQGVLVVVQDHKQILPVTTQYLVMATLKRLYPKEVLEGLKASKGQKEFFTKVVGTPLVYDCLLKQKTSLQEFRHIHQEVRLKFLQVRKKYLFQEYQ